MAQIPLSAVYNANNIATTLFTVPTGEKYRIRKIRITNQSGVTQGVSISIGLLASGANQIRSGTITMTAGLSEDIWGPFTIDAAGLMQAVTTSSGGMVLVIDYDRILLG